MAKKTMAAKKPVVKKAARKSAPAVLIDYPQPDEIVRPGHYSIRLSAPHGSSVQVRLDAGAWQDCRHAAGHYWHDWAPQAGRVCVQARSRIGAGRWSASAEREVVVTMEGLERDGALFA